MKHNTHMLASLACGLAINKYTDLIDFNYDDPANFLLLTGGLLLGSLLPDIDHRNSKLSQKLKGLSYIVSKFFKHRGFTHSITALVGLYFLLDLLSKYLILYFEGYYLLVFSKALLIGYGSHIALDLLTPEGVQLFYPLKKKFRLLKVTKERTNYKRLEKLVFSISFILVFSIIYLFYKK